VIVPHGVIELYIGSPKNQALITVIKAVSISGRVTLLILIIPGKVHMDSWYHLSLVGTERVLLSESGYTNDQLTME
jgi:hypothetical protein